MREPELSYGLRLTNYRLERPVAAARNVFSDATRTAKERFDNVKIEFGDLQYGSDERLARKIVEERHQAAQENGPEIVDGEARGDRVGIDLGESSLPRQHLLLELVETFSLCGVQARGKIW